MRSMRRRYALLATTAVIGLLRAVGCGTGDTESPRRTVHLPFWSGYAGPAPHRR